MEEVNYFCSHQILIFGSETYRKESKRLFDTKQEPDEYFHRDGEVFELYFFPNSFFNKILSEIDIPKKERSVLRINNIESIFTCLKEANKESNNVVFVNKDMEVNTGEDIYVMVGS